MHTISSTWMSLIQQFFSAFTAPGAQIFLALVTGWVLCTARHTITGMLPFADPDGRHAHDAFHRFLAKARWDMNALWQRLTILLVKVFAAAGIIELDLDDTLFHRCGRKVCGAGWWRDAVLYEPLAQTRGKKKRGRPATKGRRLPSPEQMAPCVRSWRSVTTLERGQTRKRLIYARKVVWYHVSKSPVLLVISRDPEGKERDDFFFTTDLSLAPEQVVGGFAGRWSIEDTFKNTKQFLGAEEPQTWKGQGPERAAMLSLWLSSVVWLWYLSQKARAGKLCVPAWYPKKGHPSFQDALAGLRRRLWTQRIISMFGKRLGHGKNTDLLLEALSRAT